MAKTVNKVILLGNVGKDPEIRATGGGTMIATFSIATSERVKNAGGEYNDKTEWHNLKAFGKTAEIIRDYVQKGTKLYVEGKLTTNSWEDKTSGEKKYRTEIIVNELSLLSGGNGEGGGKQRSSGDKMADNNYGYGNAGKQPVTDEDIPF
jgi:single-strand DNA-binding protein